MDADRDVDDSEDFFPFRRLVAAALLTAINDATLYLTGYERKYRRPNPEAESALRWLFAPDHGQLGEAGTLAWCLAIDIRVIRQHIARHPNGAARLALWQPAGRMAA